MRPIADRRRARLAAAGAAAAITAVVSVPAQQPGQPPQPPTPRFRAEADVVVVEATVVDRKGSVVSGLTAADFKVEIGGKAREVLSAELFEYEKAGEETREARPRETEITTNEPVEQGRQILVIVDQSSIGQLLGRGPGVPVAGSYPPHAITERFNVITSFPSLLRFFRVPGNGTRGSGLRAAATRARAGCRATRSARGTMDRRSAPGAARTGRRAACDR